MQNDFFKVSEEYANTTARVAEAMKANSAIPFALDYDLIIETCVAGNINSNAITEHTIQLVQDIRVLMQFSKEKFFTEGLTCVKKENNTYYFQDENGLKFKIKYDVLKDVQPAIYRIKKSGK